MIGEIKNRSGERLDYSIHEDEKNRRDIVVIGHGVTGNKDRPFVVALANGLARAGISAIRFSFSGNGASQGKFVDSTISKEIEDLGAILDALTGFRVCYAGHSMGGAVGVLRASKDDRIRLLVSLAGMVHTRAFAEREFGNVKPGEGFMWDDSACPLSQAYMDDMKKIDSVLEDGSKIKVPWLLVHGTEDDVVPIPESHEIFAKASQPKKFIEIKGANHVFAGEFADAMVQQVVDWASSQLRAR